MNDNYAIFAEPVDGCGLSCVLCWNNIRRGSMENMSLDIVKEIVKKHGHVHIHWYNWGEPLLHRKFVELSELVKPTAVSFISSSFSLNLSDEYIKALNNWKKIIVGMSGMTQDVYEIYNKGGKLELVFSNIEKFLCFNQRPLMVRWQSHPFNEHQKEAAKQYCKEHGLAFEIAKLNCDVEHLQEGFEHPLLMTPKFNTKLPNCVITRWFPIGADGSYLLCCATRNIKTGYTIFDNISIEELWKVRMNLELCKLCKEKKLFQMYG